jgi:hypothetical protein
MGIRVDNKVVEAAVKAPQAFIAASVGEGQEYHRGVGIQLTKEQIISLRKYEVLGLSLPIRLQDVIAYLNYGAGDSGGVGLKPADFLFTFTKVYDHAKGWSTLREEIKLTGTHLKIFAGSIIRTGRAIVEVYDDLKVSRYLEEHNINTPEEFLKLKLTNPDLPDLNLSAADVKEIGDELKGLLKKISDCHLKAEAVRGMLDTFGTKMRDDVLPEIARRLEFVSRNTYQADIQALQDVIDQRSKEIDELNKRYDQMVEEAIKSAAALNIGGLILGIYGGIKAEGIRKERNRLKGEQQADNQKMASKNQTLSSLNKVRDDLQNLNYVAIEAELATQNLMLVWNALSAYISASVSDADLLGEATSLRRFKNQLLGVIDPWEQIQISADQLVGVFAAAEQEYGNSFQTFRSKTLMLSPKNYSAYPEVNMAALRNYAGLIQAENTTAQMLFEQFDYLPGTVSSMNDICLAVQKAVFDIRDQAQKNVIHLQRAQSKLMGLQAELDEPDDEQDIHEDMELQLKGIINKLSERYENLKGSRTGMSTAYDRTTSQGWVATLQQDRDASQALKINAEEKLIDLEAEMKVVSEGIDLIGKAGVEKIGEQAQLTLDRLKALGLAPPQVQIALLAIDTLKKMISGIGEAISFFNMLAFYDRLKDKAADLRTRVRNYQKDITRIDGKIRLVAVLDRLDDERWNYVNEYSNLEAVSYSLCRDFEQNKAQHVEERAATAIARIDDVVKYLRQIQ